MAKPAAAAWIQEGITSAGRISTGRTVTLDGGAHAPTATRSASPTGGSRSGKPRRASTTSPTASRSERHSPHPVRWPSSSDRRIWWRVPSR